MKTSTQLKALIRNLSKKSNVEAEILLRNFMMERFLERIAVSDYKHNFILKTQIEDGAVFSFQGIEEIREEADYPGYRVSIGAIFDKTRQMLKIDITTGDSVTPREIEYVFKLMFEDRTISIMAYNLETVLAEKYETIITRGVTNTRMRDFYDVYVLTNTQTFDANIFKTALNKTAEKRGTTKQMSEGVMNTIDFIMGNETMTDLWQKYQKKYFYAADITWVMVINAVKALAENSLS